MTFESCARFFYYLDQISRNAFHRKPIRIWNIRLTPSNHGRDQTSTIRSRRSRSLTPARSGNTSLLKKKKKRQAISNSTVVHPVRWHFPRWPVEDHDRNRIPSHAHLSSRALIIKQTAFSWLTFLGQPLVHRWHAISPINRLSSMDADGIERCAFYSPLVGRSRERGDDGTFCSRTACCFFNLVLSWVNPWNNNSIRGRSAQRWHPPWRRLFSSPVRNDNFEWICFFLWIAWLII